MNFYPLSSLSSSTPLTMNNPGPHVNPPIHSWYQSQQTPQSREQYIPSSTLPSSYVSNITFPSSTSYTTQDRPVVNNNQESNVYGQQTIPGMANGSRQLTIAPELLNQQTTFEALSRMDLEELIFLGPHSSSIEYFLNSRDVFITRAIHILEHVHSLKKVTFSLDFTDLARILKTLAKIFGMQEIELTLPTASKLQFISMNMVDIQDAFIAGLRFFWHIKRLTIPMEFVTALLLSHLAVLSNLESLTVKYSPRPRSPHQHQQQQRFPEWSSHTTDCPGSVFLTHLNFDPRGRFKQLLRLDLSARLSDASYTTLRTLFPDTHICWMPLLLDPGPPPPFTSVAGTRTHSPHSFLSFFIYFMINIRAV